MTPFGLLLLVVLLRLTTNNPFLIGNPVYVSLRNLLRLCYCSGLVFAIPLAGAQVSSVGPVATRSGNSFTVAYPSGGSTVAPGTRSVSAGSSPGTFTVTDALSVAVPAGFLPLAVTRGVTSAAVASALVNASAAATGIGIAALGIASYQLLQDYRVRSSAAGGLEYDPGAEKTPKDTWKTAANCGGKYTSSGYVPNIGEGGSSGAIINCQSMKASTDYIPMGCSDGYMYPSGSQYSMICTYRTAVAPNGYIATESISSYKSTVLGCADVVDALTGQSAPGAVGGDGKCLTGRYQPISAADAASRVAPGVTVDSVRDYILSGSSIAHPVAQSTPTAISGPTSQVGAPTTSVTNSGNVTTTTVNTPTYNYSYGGTTVNYTVTNSATTTTTNTGTGTSTTETTTKPETTIPGLCDLFPSISACARLDVPEGPDLLPTLPHIPDITPHVLSSSATCPAPISVSFPRISFVVQWTPLCDLARDFLAPIVAVLSVFSAARVFFGGFRV